MLLAVFDDMEQCNAQEIERLMQVVSAQRRQYAQKYKFAIDQFCCLKAFEMLYQLVSLVLNKEVRGDDLSFDFTHDGCPYLKNFSDVSFSISHCKNAIVVAVDTQPVGVDVETIACVDNEFLARVMSSDERAKIIAADNSDLTFTNLWTQKEAVLKCNGTGISDIDELPSVLASKNSRIQLHTTENIEKRYVYSVASF